MMYFAWGYVQRCNLWPWGRIEKKTEIFMHQTGYAPHEILDLGWCPGGSNILQVAWNVAERSLCCGVKIAISHWLGGLGPWLIRQLVVLYKPWFGFRHVWKVALLCFDSLQLALLVKYMVDHACCHCKCHSVYVLWMEWLVAAIFFSYLTLATFPKLSIFHLLIYF